MTWIVIALAVAVVYLLLLRRRDLKAPPYAFRHLIEQARADFRAAAEGTLPSLDPPWFDDLSRSTRGLRDKYLRDGTGTVLKVFQPTGTVDGYPAWTLFEHRDIDWAGLVQTCNKLIAHADYLALDQWLRRFRL